MFERAEERVREARRRETGRRVARRCQPAKNVVGYLAHVAGVCIGLGFCWVMPPGGLSA